MSLNQIPRDKKGKPLKAGQMVVAEFRNGIGPPELLWGRVIYVGKEKSFVMPYDKKGDTIDNSKIEIRID